MKLSNEALDLLRKMLAEEVAAQVRRGEGEEPMSPAWSELHLISLES